MVFNKWQTVTTTSINRWDVNERERQCQISIAITYRTRAHPRFAPSQWEMVLLCNDVSHWLGASLESALRMNSYAPADIYMSFSKLHHSWFRWQPVSHSVPSHHLNRWDFVLITPPAKKKTAVQNKRVLKKESALQELDMICPSLERWVNTLWPRQDKMAPISQTTFSNAFSWLKMYKFQLRFHWSLFPRVKFTIFHPALVQIMAWHRPGDKPLSEPMMIILLTHICVTQPQWVNYMASDMTMAYHCYNIPVWGTTMSTMGEAAIQWHSLMRHAY